MSKKGRERQRKDRRLRILWNSNAVFCKSGYANQSRDLLYRFLADGWPVAQSAFYGLEGGIIELNGLRMYPKLALAWGEDAAIAHGNDWNADITICFQDSWVMDINALRQMRRYTPYVPIDHDPVQDIVLQKMSQAYRIITYSHFGQKQLWSRGYNSTYIPHGVDLAVFKPLQQAEVRQKYGLPADGYIWGMVSDNKDNPPRKQFQRIMDAFAEFKKAHPNSFMYFHALLNQQGGFPIEQYAKVLGIESSILFTPPYNMAVKTPNIGVAEIMNAFDALVCTSSGEGFGMPITEVQACGKPAVVTDWTSMPELIIEGVTGFAVDAGYHRYSPLLSFIADPDPKDIYKAMEKTFKLDKEATAKACRDHILAQYDINKICRESWYPFFEEIQADIYKE